MMTRARTADRAPLTSVTVLALAKIVQAAQLTARVSRMTPEGDVLRGTVRNLVVSPDNPVFLRATDEVRDAYLWVSGVWEHFWPVSELVGEVARGTLGFRFSTEDR